MRLPSNLSFIIHDTDLFLRVAAGEPATDAASIAEAEKRIGSKKED